MTNTETRRFLANKLVSDVETEIENGVFYHLDHDYIKRNNKGIEHLLELTDKYEGLELRLIECKTDERIRLSHDQVNELLKFDVHDFGCKYSLFDKEKHLCESLCHITRLVESDETNRDKLILIKESVSNHFELEELEKQNPDKHIVLVWGNFFCLMDKESTKYHFDNYNFEIGFYLESEIEELY